MDLDPELAAIIEAIPSWSGREVRAEPLEGGITNRNVRVQVDGEAFVIRLPGKDTEILGIDRQAERMATEAAAAVGVAPEVFAFLPDRGILITRFVEAAAMPPERLEESWMLSAVAGAVRSIHGMAPIPSSFDVFHVVADYRSIAAAKGVRIPPAYDDALQAAEEIRRVFEAASSAACSCHNDLLNANFLLLGERVMIVDYEYAGMGDRFFDLGNLSINNGLGEDAQESLLEAYFGSPNDTQRSRHKLMRVMSDFREAMWGVVQQGISTLEFDYVGYSERHFERCLANAADERFGTWLAAADGEM